MSEQKVSYMAQLDQWIDANVVRPILAPHVFEDEMAEAATAEGISVVKRAIREKVLESYKNGCRAAAGAVRKDMQKGSK